MRVKTMDTASSSLFMVILFASFVQSITGFGFAVIGTPLLLFFMEPKEVVVLMVFGAFMQNLMVTYKTRGMSDPKFIWSMFIASLFGIIPGVYILKVIDGSILKLLIGIAILLASAVMAGNYTVRIKRQKLATVLVGILSGFMGGSTSLSGPPVALFLMNQQKSKEYFRANLVRYFCLGNIATMITMYFMGTMDTVVFKQGIYILPGILLGGWLGEKAFQKVGPQIFRWVSLTIVLFCGAMSVGSELLKRLH
jgi:uncharacterized membrane protein YfcA